MFSSRYRTRLTILTSSFFIITKPQDKNSCNWPVGSGHSRLGLQIYFFIVSENADSIDYGEGGEKGGHGSKMGWSLLLIIICININKYIYNKQCEIEKSTRSLL